MKLALLGVGNAGVRLVDRLHGAEGPTHLLSNGNVLAVNTTPTTFDAVEHIDESRQVLIGDTHPEVYQPEPAVDDGTDADRSEADVVDRREGVAGDPELGAAVAREDLPELRRALDDIDDTEVDAAMIVAGLGGGTGCGVSSVLLEELASIYEIPIYVLGVLPSADESDQRAWSAARAIRTLVPMADGVLPVDNEVWHTDETYEAVNEAVATRIVSLFGAGEREGLPLSELRMDPNDISRTLAVGGLSTIGYVQTELSIEPDGWLDKLRKLLGVTNHEPEAQTDATTIKKLVERAVDSKLTLPCEISTADRVLLILSGPPRELSRKGFETGRSLLEDKTGTVEILAGDEPDTEATAVTATVLLSNVTDVPRIEQLQQRALAFQTGQPVAASADQSTADAAVSDEQSAENKATSTVDGEHETANSDDTDEELDEHGFRFSEKEPVDPIDLITEAESTADDSVDESDDSVDSSEELVDGSGESVGSSEEPSDGETGETGERAENEPSDESEETETPDDASDSADDPNIKDPFADGTATDDTAQ